MKTDKVKELVFKMMTQNTGTAMCDSGGYPSYDENGNYIGSTQGYGRTWEQYKNKTIEYFDKQPEVTFQFDWGYTISTFHYLTKQLELDALCNKFNKLPCEAFDSKNGYGISQTQEDWLREKGFEITGKDFNSYNYDSNLSQVVQTQVVKEIDSLNEEGDYLLVQTHNGCDTRGGYSDAKLFKPSSLEHGYCALLSEEVTGLLCRGNLEIPISNMYDGYNLRVDGDVNVTEDPDQLKLFSVEELDKFNPKEYELDTVIEFVETDNVELYLNIY